MKFLLKSLFWTILIGIFLASFLPHIFPNYWLTDIFSHFKLQYIILLLMLLLGVFFNKKRIFSVLLIVILIGWNSWFILPLYLENPGQNKTSTHSISILSINLLASNTNYLEVKNLIREKDADVLILLELSPQWENQMEKLYEIYPYRLMYPQKNNFGIGFLSKEPITSKLIIFGNNFPPSILGQLRVDDQLISILATHPVPPVNQDMFELRNLQLKKIAKFRHRYKENFIVIGDLNTTSYSLHFRQLLKASGLRDSRKGFGIASTWPVDFYPLRITLDHCLISKNLQIINRNTERDIGSDHLPIFVKIGL